MASGNAGTAAIVLLGIWFALQLLSALSMNPGEPGVAFWAHVGGFLTGMALVLVLRPRASPSCGRG